MNNKKYYEIMFIYFAEFKNEEDKKIEYQLENCEGNDDLIYEWLDVNQIQNHNILPIALKNLIIENKFPTHKIHID